MWELDWQSETPALKVKPLHFMLMTVNLKIILFDRMLALKTILNSNSFQFCPQINSPVYLILSPVLCDGGDDIWPWFSKEDGTIQQ